MNNFVIVDDDYKSTLSLQNFHSKFTPQAKEVTFTEPEIALDKIGEALEISLKNIDQNNL